MRLNSLKLNWAHKGRRNCRRPGRVAVSDAQSAPATTTATTLLTLGQLSTWSRPHLLPYHLRLRRTTGSGQTILGRDGWVTKFWVPAKGVHGGLKVPDAALRQAVRGSRAGGRRSCQGRARRASVPDAAL